MAPLQYFTGGQMQDATVETGTIRRNESILFNDFDDGLMMMDIDSGSYFDVESVGRSIWTLLDAPKTLDDICLALQDEYEVDAATCRTETGAFLSDLAARGLIEVA